MQTPIIYRQIGGASLEESSKALLNDLMYLHGTLREEREHLFIYQLTSGHKIAVTIDVVEKWVTLYCLPDDEKLWMEDINFLGNAISFDSRLLESPSTDSLNQLRATYIQSAIQTTQELNEA